jgi:hypothetical protein
MDWRSQMWVIGGSPGMAAGIEAVGYNSHFHGFDSTGYRH